MWQFNWQTSIEYCTIAQFEDIITTQKCHKNFTTWAYFVEKFDRTLTSWQSTCRQICSAYVFLHPFFTSFTLNSTYAFTDLSMTPTTLKESAARVVKISELLYSPENLPRTLIDYLSFANCCVNPNCKGE